MTPCSISIKGFRKSKLKILSNVPRIIYSVKILKRLGEKDPESVLKVRKYRCQNRDVAIYVLYHLGVYLNREIGKVFGVGYTAVPGAAKRGQGYLRSDGHLERVIKKIIAVI